MAHRVVFSTIVGLLLVSVLQAAAWARPCIDDVLLGFGASYTASGAVRTHRGVDVAMNAGSSVEAPEAGTVRFAGRVPGSDGGTVLAVTIATEFGSMSLLPFARASVRVGETVEQGQVVGELAASGDGSSGSAHVHIGLRRGDLYVDPSVLLAEAAPAPTREPEPREAPAEISPVRTLEPVESPVAPVSPIVVESPVVAEVPSPGIANAPVPDAAAEVEPGAGQPVAQPAPAIPVASPDARGLVAPPQPRTGLAVSVREYLRSGLLRTKGGASAGATDASPLGSGVTLAGASTLGSAATDDRVSESSALPASVADAGRAVGSTAVSLLLSAGREALALIAVGAIAAGLAYVLLLRRRALERQISGESPVSDRLGRLLQQLRAGDTLCGLTSCSGHAAFTVPEPSSPGEVTK